MAKIIDKRKAIFDATLELISEHGFHGTSMSMIYKKAGVSAGIIYHYFESKDELMIELYKELKKKIAENTKLDAPSKLPTKAQVIEITKKIMKYYFENPIESAFLDQFSKSPYYTRELEDEALAHFEEHGKIMEQALEEMIIKDHPFAVFHAFTVDVASVLIKKHELGMIELTDELIEKIIESSWEAVRL